jgi:acylphosphatase
VEKLVEWCRQGPPMAKVTSALVDWETPTGEFESFDVAY